MQRTRRLVAPLAAVALLLTACGPFDSTPSGDGKLVIGTLLGGVEGNPQAQRAGVTLAVDDINAAGGVNGKKVKLVEADSADHLTSLDVDAVIGTGPAAQATANIGKLTDAGIATFSASAGPPMSTLLDKGTFARQQLYFSTAPSDVLQGQAVTNLVLGDGHSRVAVLARQDAYGESLSRQVMDSVQAAGASIATMSYYLPSTTDFGQQMIELSSSRPDSLVVVGFDETRQIIPTLIKAGLGPRTLPTYLVDGNLLDYSAESYAADLAGVQGTRPGGPVADGFDTRLLGVDAKLDGFNGAAEAYDAVVIAALAATKADNDSGEGLAEKVPSVTTLGTKCTTYADCTKLLAAGEEIDYDGLSGPIELSGSSGAPKAATFGVFRYGADGRYSFERYLAAKI